MKQEAVCLSDYLVASIVQRGTATSLTLQEAELYDSEHGVYVPAKSISVTNRDGLIALRDMLNDLDL